MNAVDVIRNAAGGAHGRPCPFPWPGGKFTWGKHIWPRFGDPKLFVEPFAGGLGALLSRPLPWPVPKRVELVSDIDGLVTNFWRSVQYYPGEVAQFADNPISHHDLMAWQRWLVAWRNTESEKLELDPRYCDPEMAGRWCWGLSISIAQLWASDDPDGGVTSIPHCRGTGSMGVSRLRKTDFDLELWIARLSSRLTNVVTFKRDWKKCVVKSVLGKSAAIFLDPPYLIENRYDKLYSTDVDKERNNEVAEDAWNWAVENGNRFQVAYCCREGDFEVPHGWDAVKKDFPSGGSEGKYGKRKDMIIFSPACIIQRELF